MINHSIDEKVKDIITNDYGINVSVSMYLCKELSQRLYELKVSSEERQNLLKYLNLLSKKDIMTTEHCIRVGLLFDTIAREIKIDSNDLLYAGLLHDVGKALVPLKILKKTNDFGQRDMKIMRRHPLLTFRLVKDDFDKPAQISVRHHKHQPDGYPKEFPVYDKGYSSKIVEEIEYSSKILAIADFFDAAISRGNSRFFGEGELDIDKIIELMIKYKFERKELIYYLNDANIFNNHLKTLNNMKLH